VGGTESRNREGGSKGVISVHSSQKATKPRRSKNAVIIIRKGKKGTTPTPSPRGIKEEGPPMFPQRKKY
jgi:hypothetical protein